MEDRIKVTGIAFNANVAKITVQGVPDRPGLAAALFEPLTEAAISIDTIVQNTGSDRVTDISFTVNRADLSAAVRLVEGVAPQLGATGVASASGLASVSIVGSGMQNTPGYASRMFRVLANGGVNIDMITTSEISHIVHHRGNPGSRRCSPVARRFPSGPGIGREFLRPCRQHDSVKGIYSQPSGPAALSQIFRCHFRSDLSFRAPPPIATRPLTFPLSFRPTTKKSV